MPKMFKNHVHKDKTITTTAKKTGLNLQLKRPALNTGYAFAKPAVVAADKYVSTIVDVKRTKTKAGEEAIDVYYDMVSRLNKTFHVLMRYPLNSTHFAEFIEALWSAGLSEEDDVIAAVGVKEKIVLEYVDGATIGSITARAPFGNQAVKAKVIEDDDADESEAEDEYDELDLSDESEDEGEDF